MEHIREQSLRATVVLLTASVVLIGPGLAGIGGSPLVAIALGAVSAGLVAVRSRLEALPVVWEQDLGEFARDLWLGPLLGAATLVVFMDATPAELQTLGGLAGFLGMMNYFLRPLYLFAYDMVVRLRSTVG